MDKYAVAVKKDGKIVGHLPLRKNGKFAKRVFNFLQGDITVTGKAVNLADDDDDDGDDDDDDDDDGIKVPCVLRFSGQKSMVEILKQQTGIK